MGLLEKGSKMRNAIAACLSIWLAAALAGCSAQGSTDSERHDAEDAVQEQQPAQEQSQQEESADKPAFSMVGVKMERTESPYSGVGYNATFTLRNDGAEEQTLLGFNVVELNAAGNVISSYQSFNKNAVQTPVEPGQEASVTLYYTEADGQKIAGYRVDRVYIGDYKNIEATKLAEPFKQML